MLRGAMGSGAAIEVGDEVTIKATKITGVAKQSNGHACKVGNLWYHIDELEVAPKASTPVRCGGPGAYPVPHPVAGGWNDAKAPGQRRTGSLAESHFRSSKGLGLTWTTHISNLTGGGRHEVHFHFRRWKQSDCGVSAMDEQGGSCGIVT